VYLGASRTCTFYVVDSDRETQVNIKTVDYLIYECNILKTERAALLTNIPPRAWPMEKRKLLKEHTKQFSQFIESIDFEVINSDINSE
jgi:hypothetical protein